MFSKWRNTIITYIPGWLLYGFRVVAVDLRGYGESDAPSAASEYTMDKLVEDIRQLIPSLGNKQNNLGENLLMFVKVYKYDMIIFYTQNLLMNCDNVFQSIFLIFCYNYGGRVGLLVGP